MDERLHPVDKTAERLGVAAWTVRGWIQFGKIESHKIEGRRLISESEILRIIEESRMPRNPRARIRVRSNEEAQNSATIGTRNTACAIGD